MEPGVLKKQILSTVAYYDVLDYPLTAFEIWKYLTVTRPRPETAAGASLDEIRTVLDGGELGRWIARSRGFYFLKGRKELISLRIRRSKLAAEKLKSLRRLVFWMQAIPFVRMMAVTGRLALKQARPGSDWDLLVVLKKGRIWTGRTLVTLFAEIIGRRRKARKTRDRLCLNYFITESSLEIANKDLFSANEYSFAIPLFGGKTFTDFQAANSWLREYKPDFSLSEVSDSRLLPENRFLNLIRKGGEKLLNWDWIEDRLRRFEKLKIKHNPLTDREGSLVSATDEALVFLPEPQGPKVFERFQSRLDQLLAESRNAT